mgnify:CR=1 FL=1
MAKLRMVLLVLITVFLLVIATGVVLLFTIGLPQQGDNRIAARGLSAAAVQEVLWTSPEIRTNIKTGNLVLVQYAFQMENKKAVEEMGLRSHQVSDAIITLLQDQSKEDMLNSENSRKLREMLQQRLNQFLQEGKVVEVYTIQQIVQ